MAENDDAKPPALMEDQATPAPELSPEEQAAKEAAEKEAAEREAALNRLMARISKNSNFPSLRDSIRSIQKVARSDTAHRRAFTDQVLDDVALTAKLLRLINAAYYSSVGAGSITSIDRALSLMGFQMVGMLAGSLMLFERMPKGPAAEHVKRCFNRALLSGLLAQEFCHSTKQFEGAYITALFLDLGLMLVEMHFPEDAQTLRVNLDVWRAENPEASDQACHDAHQRISRQILGLSCEDIGIEVARQWGWPENLTSNLRRHYIADPEQPASAEEYMRVLCTAATELSVRIQALPPHRNEDQRAEAVKTCLRRFAGSYAGPLSFDAEALPETGIRSLQSWESMSVAMGLTEAPAKVKGTSPSTHPKGTGRVTQTGETDRRATAASRTQDAMPRSAQLSDPASLDAGTTKPSLQARRESQARERMQQDLSRTLADVGQWIHSGLPIDTLLSRTAQALLDTLRAQRVVVCLRDGQTSALVGRLGKGHRAQAAAACFQVPLDPPRDVFGILCTHGKDTLISDTRDPIISQRLPAWFHAELRAGTFLLLPMSLGEKPIGAIYADKEDAASLGVGEQELSVLKALRDQVVSALRLKVSGHGA
jgi:HD-like signal output (HDOD) protein